jgi:LmbE family N-acetylglucosaminyl deacetylase
MSLSQVVLSVAPHPDDELVGAPATLMALRDAGWRVVNLACSLGRREDRRRRRAELAEACRMARFELATPEGIPPIGRDHDLERAQRVLSAVIVELLEETAAPLIVGPSPHDGHHGHEVVGRAIRDAVQTCGGSLRVMFWGLWADLPIPNLLVPFGARRLEEIQRLLRSHAGELARNRLDLLVENRAAANVILGPERVFGFGVGGIEHPYAELLTDVSWAPGAGWRLMAPRELDALHPLAGDEGPEIGWWLHGPSVRGLLSADSARHA